MSTGQTVLKYWPIIVVTAGVIATAAVDSFRISAMAEELKDQSLSIDETEEELEELQRGLLIRQGQVELDLQRIENEQQSQGDDLERIIILLERITSER